MRVVKEPFRWSPVFGESGARRRRAAVPCGAGQGRSQGAGPELLPLPQQNLQPPPETFGTISLRPTLFRLISTKLIHPLKFRTAGASSFRKVKIPLHTHTHKHHTYTHTCAHTPHTPHTPHTHATHTPNHTHTPSPSSNPGSTPRLGPSRQDGAVTHKASHWDNR